MIKTLNRVFKPALVIAFSAIITGCASAGNNNTGSIPEYLKGVKRVGFFGDSLTDGSDYPEYVINTLNKEYPSLNLTFFNAAVCGDEAHELVDRLDRDVLSQKPDLVFIMIGTNDSGGKELVQFKAELTYLIRRLRQNHSKAALITLSGSTDPKKVARFKPYDNVVREVAKEQNVLLVDAWAYFEKQQKSGIDMYCAPGDAHHSLAGFEGVARVILNALGVPENVAMVKTVKPPKNVITNWQESGPVATTKNPSTDIKTWTPYEPEKWIDQRHWSFKPLVERGAWFALQGDKSNKKYRGKTAYAKTEYEAPAAGLYEFQVGGGTPLQIWVNGKKVYNLMKTNGYHPNANRFPVLLNKGKNEIIMTTGFYGFLGIEPLK